MEQKLMKLQARLACIASCVPQGARLADVGTDHGYLPIFLLQQGRIRHAIATDLREEPLAHAERSAREYGIGGEMELRLGDGLSPVSPSETDAVVIAGMGGELIIKILQNAPWAKEKCLILQAQTKVPLLRTWLSENGFRFVSEHLVRDKGTLYVVLCVTSGQSVPLTAEEALSGVLLDKDPLYGEYLQEHTVKLTKAIEGLRCANGNHDEEIDRLSALKRGIAVKKEEWQHGYSKGN